MDVVPFEAIRNSRKPVVSAVNGICQGGGLLMAMLSDVAVASDRATSGARSCTGDRGHRVCLLPTGQIGPARARDMLFTGRTLDADQACAWGLVSRVASHDQLLDDAQEAGGLLSQRPAGTVGGEAEINAGYGRYDRMSMDESLAGPESSRGGWHSRSGGHRHGCPGMRTEGRL